MNGLNPAYVESVIRKAKDGKLTTGQAEVRTRPEPSVEKVRHKPQKRVETSYPIMTGMAGLSCYQYQLWTLARHPMHGVFVRLAKTPESGEIDLHGL